jgi:hypothetical protein
MKAIFYKKTYFGKNKKKIKKKSKNFNFATSQLWTLFIVYRWRKSVDLFDREGSSPSIPIKSKKKFQIEIKTFLFIVKFLFF